MVTYAYNSSTSEVEVEGTGVQGQPQLCHEFEPSMSPKRLPKTNKQMNKQTNKHGWADTRLSITSF